MVNFQKTKRLAALIRRAEAGEELTIAFFGGSITQGSLTSSPERCYAALVYQWFERTFPKARFHYVNGGIGGTSSLYGCARIRDDLLMYHPDFVVVDFSVNDVDENDRVQPYYQESYEAVIRRILLQNPETAVVILNNIYYDTGISADALHNEIGDHYGIPQVNIRESIYRRLLAGEFTREEISPDGLHPNDRGHRMVAEEIIRLLEEAGKMADVPRIEADCRTEAELPAPLTQNRWENTVLHTIRNTDPALDGFVTDPSEKMGHLDFWKNGWIGRKPGDAIIFHASCRCAAVQYRKTISHPACVARLVIDGVKEQAVILDGNFEKTWGDCLFLQRVLDEDRTGQHELRIEVIRTEPEGLKTPFYLLSLITA